MITASLRDAGEGVDTRNHLFLRVAPFAGDIVTTHARQRVRVIRREIIDHGGLDHALGFVDLILTVRLEEA